MTNIEWLNMRKEVCEHGIEIYYDKIKEFERELEAIKSLIGLTEGEAIEPKRNIKIVENPEYVVAYEHNEIIKEREEEPTYADGVLDTIYELGKELDISTQDLRDKFSSVDDICAVLAERIKNPDNVSEQ